MTNESVLPASAHVSQTITLGSNELLPLGEVELKFVDPLIGPEWDQHVLSHPDVSFFHSSAWARVLTRTYGHKPLYFFLCRRGEPVAFVPMMEVKSRLTGCRGVCLPFSDFCSPLFVDDCKPSVVMASLCELARNRKWKYFELRGGKGLESDVSPATDNQGHLLDLRQSEQGLLASFSSSVRRAIRKAEESDLGVEVIRSRESVAEFYRLHVQTRRRHGLPPQPFSFFGNIFDEVIRTGSGFVVRAHLKSRAVAGAIFLQLGRKAVYKFGASDPAFQNFRANNLVMWEAIRFLARSGCESLHFGRTSLAETGLRRFKLGWGTTEELIRYYRWNSVAAKWVGHEGSDKSRGLHNAFFGRLPLAVNRLGGALIYPHLD